MPNKIFDFFAFLVSDELARVLEKSSSKTILSQRQNVMYSDCDKYCSNTQSFKFNDAVVYTKKVKNFKQIIWNSHIPIASVYEPGSKKRKNVFYLIIARKNSDLKICLIDGKFFETIIADNLILSMLDLKRDVLKPYSLSQIFNLGSLNANLLKYSVPLAIHFSIDSELKADSNPFDSNKYPEIGVNTLNFLIPCHTKEQEERQRWLMEKAFEQLKAKKLFKELKIFSIRHLLNGPFLVFQAQLNP